MLPPEDAEDANMQLLARMEEDGDDLTVARDIDYNHLFPDEDAAFAFEEDVRKRGYDRVDRDFLPEEDSWWTSVTIMMTPALEAIDEVKSALDEIAANYHGRPDGWGCMETVPADPPA